MLGNEHAQAGFQLVLHSLYNDDDELITEEAVMVSHLLLASAVPTRGMAAASFLIGLHGCFLSNWFGWVHSKGMVPR